MINNPDKYQNTYRVASARASWWDYSQDAAYFVTICTQRKINYFGKINAGKMQLSEIGIIVEKEWQKTVDLRLDMNLTLGEFVVMPNHFHAIIIIGENKYNNCNNCRDAMPCVSLPCVSLPCVSAEHGNAAHGDAGDARHCVSTVVTTSPQQRNNKFAAQSKNLSSIIRGFKIGVTVNARKIHADFGWQPRFFDRILRNHQEYEHIESYIFQNPMNWENDKLYLP